MLGVLKSERRNNIQLKALSPKPTNASESGLTLQSPKPAEAPVSIELAANKSENARDVEALLTKSVCRPWPE